MKEQHYIHSDGRRCVRNSDGAWRHWDHEQPEPGPREARDYTCLRNHLTIKIKDGPLPSDRGEFGMPGLGVGQVVAYEQDMHSGIIVDCPEEPLQDNVMIAYRNAIITDTNPRTGGVRTDAVTEDARFILSDVLPHLLTKFLRKNAQYARAQTGHDLGLKGIIPDINRKSAALITAVWDEPGLLEGGDTDAAVDIAEDLIGHLLLLLAKTREA